MRNAAISALILTSLTAGCGDSGGSSTAEDAGMDGGGSSSGNNGSPLPMDEDDEDLDNACDYDPCCVGNQDYDFRRCNPTLDAGMKDAAMPDDDAATNDAGAGDAGAVDAGADASADASSSD